MRMWKFPAVGGLIILATLFPPVSFLIAPYYQETYRREWITQVEYDLDYFGAI